MTETDQSQRLADMVMARCVGGISHHPAESVNSSDVAAAIPVLERLLAMSNVTGY